MTTVKTEAAQDLYEALLECAHWVHWCIHNHGAPDSSMEEAAYAQALAALARARGDAPSSKGLMDG